MNRLRSAACLSVALAAGLAHATGPVLKDADYSSAAIVHYQGAVFRIIGGAAYERRGSLLYFVTQLYDPDFYTKNYVREGTAIYRIADKHKYPVRMAMSEDFENASTLRDLISLARGWNSVTVQGPHTPTVDAYVKLRQRLIAGTGEFIDNRVEPSRARARSGAASLRTYARAASRGLEVSKASLECELLHYRKGDHFWFSGWFNIAEGSPTGILDLESSFVAEYPGLRVLLSEELQPRVELKWADKPSQVAAPEVRLPRNQWVQLRMHAYLSDHADGLIELWIDNQQVIRENAQTLPLADTVYDRLEIGISANATRSDAVVFVDQLKVDDKPLW